MKMSIKNGVGIIALLLFLSLGIFYLDQPTEIAINPINTGAAHLAGNFQIRVKLDPEKPKIGKNQLTLVIRDSKDRPVTDAAIQAFAEMPAMGSMQAMREPVSIENIGPGLYQGHYSLPMNGSWPLTVSISSINQGKAELLFDMNTSRTGVKLAQATPSDLSPHSQKEAPEHQPAEFNVDSYRRQLIGVTTAEVVYQNLTKTIHAGARVTYDQSRLTDITLKYDAWIGQLHADYVGKYIQQGETLFTAYSPDLVSVQDEYLDSLKLPHSLELRKATRRRLALLDVNAAQVKAWEKRGKAIEYLPIPSPVTGTIVEKNTVAGSAIKAGAKIMRLADLSTVWIEGEVYEFDLPWIKIGMPARITLPEQPGLSYTATVTFIDPVLNPHTRSAVIRAQLTNSDGSLRPDMYATMQLQVDLGERMVVPEQAVIYSGDQRIVFVDKGHGRLLPKKIKTGLRNENMIEVQDGLAPGDVIVTSGNFLIAAESKLKAGLAQW